MIVWMAIVGALAGWLAAGLDSYGFFLGGLCGAFVGWSFRSAVRAEVTRATAPLQDQIAALVANGVAAPDPFFAPAVPAPTPVVVPARARTPPTDSWSAAPSPRQPAAREPVTTTPPEPGIVATTIAAGIAAAKGWLLGGNTIVRVGLVILFVGLSFLASYAAAAGLFPVEARLALIVAVGIALLGFGFRTRTDRPGFGLALQGAGIATIYLTLFAAVRLLDGFPVAAAFALMIVVCALGCALALLQRSQALATTAFAGGFAVPVLLAGGGGNIVGVFVYYTILNAAILFIAQRQAWRVLNLIGFFATFGMATLWGTTSYQPGDYAAAQGFLIVSVLIYVATAVLYTRATPGRLGNVVDTTLLFGPALAGFGLQVGLVSDRPFGSAFAALGFAALYLGVAMWTMRYRKDTFRVMNETMLAIGIGFVTLAVPLALGARWTSSAWALEGAGAFWVGMRQARWMPRLFGLLLQVVAALVYIATFDTTAAVPLANPAFLGAMLIALAALATAWWLREPLPHSGSRMAQSYQRVEHALAAPAFLFGFAFWCAAWAAEAIRAVPSLRADALPVPVIDPALQPVVVMLTAVASAWLAQMLGQRRRWAVAFWPSYAALPALTLAFATGVIGFGRNILSMPDWLMWGAAIALHLRMLFVNDREASAPREMLATTHVGGVLLGVAMLADALWLGIDRAGLWRTAWAEVVFLVASIAVLLALTLTAGRAIRHAADKRWPLDRHAAAYGWVAAIPIAVLVYGGALLTGLLSSGVAAPLPYVPVLNPVDLSLGLSLATLEAWRRTMLTAVPVPPGAAKLGGTGALSALAGLAFVIVNTVWLRIAHHWLGVPWSMDLLLDSVVVQTGLAILWTVLALTLMVVAHRHVRRTLWLVGAGLLALTVLKLLLIDLNAAGGGARIIAFMGVGVLMLVVGYLAPLPPKDSHPAEALA